LIRWLAQLAALPRLVDLNLDLTKGSDAGLVSLRKLQQLKELYPRGTAVTDAGGASSDRRSPR
jgi:hypothetical protein